MKRYNFSVEVEGVDNVQSTLIDSFIEEATKDRKEQLITETINIETSKIHRKVLLDFATEINVQLEKIDRKGYGIKGFRNSPITGTSRNMYTPSAISCDILVGVTDVCYRIALKANSDRGFEDSKYTTYTGDYYLEISGKNGLRNEGFKISSVDDALEYMKDSLMKYIKNELIN